MVSRQIFRIVLHARFLEQADDFLFECELFMMLRLPSNIRVDCFAISRADGKGRVAFLPCKELVVMISLSA